MKQSILVCAMLLAASVALTAQDSSQSGAYQGTSNPPPDDTITTQSTRQKPSPSHLAAKPAQNNTQSQQSQQDRDNEMPQPASAAPVANYPVSGAAAPAPQPMPQPVQASPQFAQQTVPQTAPEPTADSGTVQVASPDPNQTPDQTQGQTQAASASYQPQLNTRSYENDPDGDIVHPIPPAGAVMDGTTIRAHLLDELSTNFSQNGDAFRAKIATDVVQNGQVLIPAGAEIDGVVVRASSGRAGGHGTLLLRPESVVLAGGQRFKLYAQVSGAPGTRTRVNGEGVINASASVKKDSIEYGGGVGAGVVTGAVLGGPVGALAGGLVGAGAVTVHLLMDHPQATLETGTVLIFTLTEPLDLVAANPSNGN